VGVRVPSSAQKNLKLQLISNLQAQSVCLLLLPKQNRDKNKSFIFFSLLHYKSAKAKKKMLNSQSHLALVTAVNATHYMPAKLQKYPSGWLIDYYVEDPKTQQLRRKKVKVTRIMSRFPTKNEAMRHLNSIVAALNIRLASGWNPLLYTSNNTEPIPVFEPANVSNTLPVTTLLAENTTQGECIVIAHREEKQLTAEELRMQTPFAEASKKYLEETIKEKRPDTIRSYTSFISIFRNWVKTKVKDVKCTELKGCLISDFMDYVYNERKVSATTYNNYVKMGRAIFTWMVDKYYISENEFSKVKLKKKEEKSRTVVDTETRAKIKGYLLENNPNYMIICKLVYNTLLRPKEIRMLKVNDIQIEQKTVRVRSEVSKNKKERIVPLTQDLINDFERIGVNKALPDHYVFSEQLRPGKNKISDAYMRKYWDKMRKRLKLSENMVLYSLRDSGMTDMIKLAKFDDISVMQLADHHSLEMTTIYTKHVDPNLQKLIYENSPVF